MHVVNVEVVLQLNSSRGRFFYLFISNIYLFQKFSSIYMSIDFFYNALFRVSNIYTMPTYFPEELCYNMALSQRTHN